jgi:ferrochelatase
VVCSYHGLPEAQVRSTQAGCLTREGCCDRPDALLGFCYRAQCLAATRQIGAALGRSDLVSCFQSRLGRAGWLTPSLEPTLDRLLEGGARQIALLSPSFVGDCLETLEELGLRARALVEARGGTLRLAPCLNADPAWVGVLAEIVSGLSRG